MFIPWFSEYEDFCQVVFKDQACNLEPGDWTSIMKVQYQKDFQQLRTLFCYGCDNNNNGC